MWGVNSWEKGRLAKEVVLFVYWSGIQNGWLFPHPPYFLFSQQTYVNSAQRELLALEGFWLSGFEPRSFPSLDLPCYCFRSLIFTLCVFRENLWPSATNLVVTENSGRCCRVHIQFMWGLGQASKGEGGPWLSHSPLQLHIARDWMLWPVIADLLMGEPSITMVTNNQSFVILLSRFILPPF